MARSEIPLWQSSVSHPSVQTAEGFSRRNAMITVAMIEALLYGEILILGLIGVLTMGMRTVAGR